MQGIAGWDRSSRPAEGFPIGEEYEVGSPGPPGVGHEPVKLRRPRMS